MRFSWRIGSLFGIPLYIDSSWLIILVFVTIINASQVNAGAFSTEYHPLLGWIAGFVMALLLFASVLLHELGHSLVARSQGIPVNSITLFLFGGVASIERESKTPGQAFQVAISGPLVSLTLGITFFTLVQFLGEANLFRALILDLARINLILALFNLIPGLPLDGGQVLKAAIWKLTGDRVSAVRWASATGQMLGWLGISGGVLVVLLTGEVAAVWIAFIGWFILRNAKAYESLTTLQSALMELTAADAMTRDFRVIDANLTLQEFAQDYILTSDTPKPYYAASEGRYRGLIQTQDLQNIERSQWEQLRLVDIAHPLTEIPSVQEKTALSEIVQLLEDKAERRLTVLSPANAVAGVIDRGDITQAVAKKSYLAIPELEIQRIKAEGTYPRGLQLDTIAKSMNSLPPSSQNLAGE